MKLFKAFGLKKAHDTQDGLWDDPPPEEAGEDVPIRGRATEKKYWGEKPRLSAEQERLGTGPTGQSMREKIDEDSYRSGMSRAAEARRPKPKGSRQADLRRGSDLAAELQAMFKAKFPQHLEQASPGGYSMLPGSPDTSGDPDVEAKRRRGHFSDYGGGYQDTSGMPDKKDPPRSSDPQPEPGDEAPITGRVETPSQKSERHYYMSERPQSRSRTGQTLADKREGRSDVGGTRTPQREPAQQWGGGTGGAYRKPKRVAEALKMIGF